MNHIFQEKSVVKELPTGDELTLVRHQIQGSEDGPVVYIQANVHGAEIQGNGVIYHLLRYFEKNRFHGTIHFVPQANPIGINQKMGAYTYGRFNPSTGENYNRAFVALDQLKKSFSENSYQQFAEQNKKSDWPLLKEIFKRFYRQALIDYRDHESQNYGLSENRRMALQLQIWAASADIVLDLHTGPDACDYLYVPEFFWEDAQYFLSPVNLIFDGIFAGAADEATLLPWVLLQKAMRAAGKEVPLDFQSFTVELGSEEKLDLDRAEKQAEKILHYLWRKGVVLERPDISVDQKRFRGDLKNFKTYFSPRGGVVDFQVKSGGYVKEGQRLAQFLSFKNMDEQQHANPRIDEVRALKAGVVVNRYPSSNVPQGHQLIQFLEDVEVCPPLTIG